MIANWDGADNLYEKINDFKILNSNLKINQSYKMLNKIEIEKLSCEDV